jgi:2-C-methyl-D-erythritol 4-phosphate cytidylyltransferase
MTTTSDDVPDHPEERPPALGLVLDEGRGSLPYALVHGEALVACAAWALGEAGVTPIGPANVEGDAWSAIRTSDEPLVLHDSLCPMTPAGFVAACVDRALAGDVVVAGVRPVTDTVKVVSGGIVGETVDRQGLLSVASPVVLPPSVVRRLPERPGTDLAALVTALVESGVTVELVEAPPEGRRVSSTDDLRLLEALTAR